MDMLMHTNRLGKTRPSQAPVELSSCECEDRRCLCGCVVCNLPRRPIAAHCMPPATAAPSARVPHVLLMTSQDRCLSSSSVPHVMLPRHLVRRPSAWRSKLHGAGFLPDVSDDNQCNGCSRFYNCSKLPAVGIPECIPPHRCPPDVHANFANSKKKKC